MSNLIMNRDVPVRQHSRADSIAMRRGRALSIAACWKWMIATSQFAVEYHYAAPWKHDADLSQASSAQAEG